MVAVGPGAVAVGEAPFDDEPPDPLDVPPLLHAASASMLHSSTPIPTR
ncbi:MAG: hypothetical protein ACRDID_18125 [Ktedonobacterales bacterium]